MDLQCVNPCGTNDIVLVPSVGFIVEATSVGKEDVLITGENEPALNQDFALALLAQFQPLGHQRGMLNQSG